MKRVAFFTALVFTLIITACRLNSGVKDDISVQTKLKDNRLQFTADFPKHKTGKVKAYIEKSLGSDSIFASPSDYLNAEVRLSDGTLFDLQCEAGYVAIDFDRTINTISSFIKMQNMYKGFAEALKD